MVEDASAQDSWPAGKLTLSEAADALEVSMATLRKLVAQGDLAVEVNPLDRRERLVPRQAIDELRARGRGAGSTRGRSPNRISRRQLRPLSPLIADADDLVNWSSQTSASLNLPRLVRRLILEAGDVSEPPRARAGEGVLLSGWDGISVFPRAHPYIPQGVGLWEMGRDKAPKAKADKEYAKRVQDSLGFDTSQSTFVFVTPRRWTAKLDWQGARRREGRWRDVRVYDADDLEAWMEIAPATRIWFSRLIGKSPDAAETLEDWWFDWCESTSPNLSSAVVLAGSEREQVAQAIQERLVGDPRSVAVQADTTDEAIAVLASAITRLPEDLAATVMARALVVRTAAAWQELTGEGQGLVLISDFPECEAAGAVRAGHVVVAPLGKDDVGVDPIRVPRLRRQMVENALIDAGAPEELAGQLATVARRSVQALRRRIAISPRLSRPDWCTREAAQALVPVLLTGHWQGDVESDQAVLSELAGRRYEELERDLAWLVNVADPPVRRISGFWLLSDRFDLWRLIHSYLAPADLERLRAVFVDVFAMHSRFIREISPSAPHWPNSVHRPSTAIREGLAESLALIAVEDIRVGDIRGQVYADRLVGAVLNSAEPGDRTIWPGLSDVLPLLGEAAPQEFMDALSRRIDEIDQGQRGTSVGSTPADPLTAAQISVLRALETLAWNRDFLGQVTLLLAKLSRLSTKNPHVVNSPEASLRNIFLAWHPSTSAGPLDRFSVIDGIAEAEPEAMWQLLRALLPRAHDIGHPTSRPRWRLAWLPDRTAGEPDSGHQQSYEMALRRLLSMASGQVDRWLDLLEEFDHLPMQFKESVLRGLEADRLQCTDDQRGRLWDRLRALAAEHRYFSDAFWRMSDEQLVSVERLAERYEPESVINRVEWAFGPRRHRALMRADTGDHIDALQDMQNRAAAELTQSGGLSLLLEAADRFEEPFELGAAVGRSSLLNEADALELVRRVDPSGGPPSHLALGFVMGAFQSRGWPWIEHIAGEWHGKLRPDQWGMLLALIPTDVRAAYLAESKGPEAAGHYWRNFRVWTRLPAEGIEGASHGLLKAGRAHDLVVLLGMNIDEESTSSQLIADVIERVAGSDASDAVHDPMYTYHVTRLLDRLAEDERFDRARAARLEWALAHSLRFERAPGLLHERLQKDPSFFVEVVTMAFRGDNESDTEISAEDPGAANRAYDLLESWRSVPGQDATGSINEQALEQWIHEARQLLTEHDRLKIGNFLIGKLLGKAGLGVRDGVPSAAVCALIERIASPDLERGVVNGVYNARGATMRGLTDGGQQERLLVATYRTYAGAVQNRWPRTAALLRRIAAIYDDEAQRQDLGAELTEDMWR